VRVRDRANHANQLDGDTALPIEDPGRYEQDMPKEIATGQSTPRVAEDSNLDRPFPSGRNVTHGQVIVCRPRAFNSHREGGRLS
jgi:hypothetical protein